MARALLAAFIALALLTPDQARQTVTGVITDDECASGDHTHMQMGPTAADCTRACIDSHGAVYMLFDGRTSWRLSDQKTPETFAGQKVVVTGTLDAQRKTIAVESIKPSK